MATAQAGCASGLDFDHVSSGHHGADAGAHAAVDAGRVRPIASADTADRLDAGAPAPAASRDAHDAQNAQDAHDAGSLSTSPPNARAGASGARSSAAGASGAGSSETNASAAGASGARSSNASDAGTPDAALGADPTAFSCAKVSPKPFFCDDFESLPLGGHWSKVEVYPSDPLPGGTLEIDSQAARAGQKSLLAVVNEGVSVCDDCIGLLAELTLPNLQGPTKLFTEFDVRVEQIDPNIGRRVVLFQTWWGAPEAGFTQHSVQLESNGGSVWTGLVEIATSGQAPGSNDVPNRTPAEHNWLQMPALSEWAHVVYTLDVQDSIGTANVATLTIDGVVLFDGPLAFPLHNAKAQIELGVPWVDMTLFREQDTSKSWRIRYDNVLVRYEPR